MSTELIPIDNTDNTKAASLDTIKNTLQLIEKDPIIQQLLANRGPMNDVDDDKEVERQCRMYTMLRYSRKYRKIQVAQANEKWEEATSTPNVNCFEEILDKVKLTQQDDLLKCVSFETDKHDSGINTPTLSSQDGIIEPIRKKRAPRVSFSETVHIIKETDSDDATESDIETLYQERRSDPKSFLNLFKRALQKAYKRNP